jgi:hypothetical protein
MKIREPEADAPYTFLDECKTKVDLTDKTENLANIWNINDQSHTKSEKRGHDTQMTSPGKGMLREEQEVHRFSGLENVIKLRFV